MEAKRIQSSIAEVVDYLRTNPSKATSVDTTAIATVDGGLRCRVRGPMGAEIITDMPPAIGGGGSAPSAGWVFRAALAACDATAIAMRAAIEDVPLTELEVTVDSDSDDRGLIGADDSVPPGPLRVRVHVRIVSPAPPEKLRRLVEWAELHSPIGDVVRRSVPISTTIETG